MNRYIVMESAAQVRGKMREFGRYRRVALVEITGEYALVDARPKMISPRAKGVVRILEEWSPMFQGKTDRCEYAVAMREAEAYARAMNAGAGWNRLARRPELTAEEVEHIKSGDIDAQKGGD